MTISSASDKELRHLTWLIRLFCMIRIPLLAFCWPRIERIDSKVAEVSISHHFLTKNHVRSMYFGALAMGAELSTAVRLLQRMKNEKLPLGFIFKDAQFEFIKRVESDAIFRIEQVSDVDELIQQGLNSENRVDKTLSGWVYSKSEPDVILMKYSVTLSIKKTKKGLF